MVVDEYTFIQISRSNKEKLDNIKILKRESYNSVLGMLIEFGEENNFKSIRLENLNKELVDKGIKNANNKTKQRAIGSTPVQ